MESAQLNVRWQPLVDLLPELYRHCQGNAVRIREVLHLEHNLEVPYGTLIRQESLRKQSQRVYEYPRTAWVNFHERRHVHGIASNDLHITPIGDCPVTSNLQSSSLRR
ncbi:MAG: hypothetical protein HQM03_16030 [Magnetococcales bacterium]|nr:hypothetical protein [Magnetococcales bacterium]